MPINVFKFRNKWPLGTIRRGYEHPFHPLPAITLMVLCIATYFAVYLGYGRQLLAMMAFYIIASLWFAFHRYKFVRRGDQFTMPWPKTAGTRKSVVWGKSVSVRVDLGGARYIKKKKKKGK